MQWICVVVRTHRISSIALFRLYDLFDYIVSDTIANYKFGDCGWTHRTEDRSSQIEGYSSRELS